MTSADPRACPTLPDLLQARAGRHGDQCALKYIDEDGAEVRWSYAELWNRAVELASRLPPITADAASSSTSTDPNSSADASQRPRALLLFPPGLEFLAGFVGCQIAGYIPVPTCYPKPGRRMPRLDSAAADCRPSLLIADSQTLAGLDDRRLGEAVRVTKRVATDETETVAQQQEVPIRSSADSIAFLQYTSGSTSEPKGVMVRHRNLMANLEGIRRGFHIQSREDDYGSPEHGVFWLPFFHDMGLIGGILEPLYAGGTSVLISPRTFLQQPFRWLELISQERASVSGAPNFAYQLAFDRVSPEQTERLDLTSWRTAFCGAEPISARTLSDFANRFSVCGFSRKAFYPCYGLAEATLLVAGGDGPDEVTVVKANREALGHGKLEVNSGGRGSDTIKLVSCGNAVDQTELIIVDPESRTKRSDGHVGEIWISGPGVTDGYWGREQENESQFRATLSGTEDGSVTYVRTGDLGVMHHGELYVTGRLKDVVILRGRNHYPQDIEATVREAMGSAAGTAAAFSIDGARGEVLAVVVEVSRHGDEDRYPDDVRAIRRALVETHEIDPAEVLLVRPATIPLTTSGKIRRSRCREQVQTGEIRSRHHYRRTYPAQHSQLALPDLPAYPSPADREKVREAIEVWLAAWLVQRGGVPDDELDLNKPFAEYGLDSLTAVEMSGEVEDWSGIEVTPIVALNHPTIIRLSEYLTDRMVMMDQPDDSAGGIDPAHSGLADDPRGQPQDDPLDQDLDVADLEGLLDEIEGLSDEEVNHALADKRRS